jgi:hypothetical protein
MDLYSSSQSWPMGSQNKATDNSPLRKRILVEAFIEAIKPAVVEGRTSASRLQGESVVFNKIEGPSATCQEEAQRCSREANCRKVF